MQAVPRRRTTPKKKPPRVRLEVDARRAQLVAFGLEAFGTRPYEEVAIDDIARAAGISKGLLFHYFPSKRAFYVACIRESAARLVAQVEDVPADAPPLEQLLLGLDAYLAYVRARGRAYATLMRGAVGLDREVAAVVDETRAALLESLTRGLAEVYPDTIGTGTTAGAERELLAIALHGWIGLAEAASIAWVESCVAAESAKRPAPPALAVRTLLASALVSLVEGARGAS